MSPALSFRRHLQGELGRRCARNPRYSLRAFARHLGVDHSTLSQILRGRRALGPTAIGRMGRKLGLDAATLHLYVEVERHERARAAAPPSAAEQLTRDAIAVLAEPHHLALLELTQLPDFRADVRWAARVLGVSADDVNIALSRMARIGLLRMERDRGTSYAGDAAVTARLFHEATLRLLYERLQSAPARAKEESWETP